MELLKVYKTKQYNNNIKKLKAILVDGINEVNDFLRQQPLNKLRIWVKITDYTIADNPNYKSESFLLITLVIRLFAMELDVDNVSLKNSEIVKLLIRFSKILKIEYSYRAEVINKKPKHYTLLKDVTKENYVDD
jgi:hypothetical protein